MDAPACPTCKTAAILVQTASAQLGDVPTIDLTFTCEQTHSWIASGLSPADAVEHVRAVITGRPWKGASHAALGLLLEVSGRADDAYEEYATAFRCDDVFDRGFCYERCAAYEAHHGWIRNALRSMRDAVAADKRASGARVGTYTQVVEKLETALTTQAIWFPPAERNTKDKRWLRDCELELPPGFGARNEAGEPFADEVLEIERRIRAGRWDDAVAAFEALSKSDANKFVDAIGFASRGGRLARKAGHHAAAIAMQRLVVHAYTLYASWSSSGGEAASRTADVGRERARLREWEAET